MKQKRHRKTLPVLAVEVRELSDTPAARSIYPLIRQLNPEMTRPRFLRLLKTMLKEGYRCAAAYDGDRCVGVIGLWMGTRFCCGKYIDIDNVAVDTAYQGRGVGEQMMAWAEAMAKREKCRVAVLDSYTYNSGSHRFYFRGGYTILGYHFSKKL